jgi:hypothetical protein
VTADVSASCQGYGCSPTTTPKVGVHVLLGGSRIATVRAPPAGSTADPAKQMDEAMKKLEEQMKNMPPEQRKQMEEMMKKYGTGK